MTDPLVDVVEREFYHHPSAPRGTGSHAFILKCGHIVYAKASQGVPLRKRCYECGQKKPHSVRA